MEVDTAVSVSLVFEATYRQLSPDRKMEEVTCKLTTYTYTGEPLKVLGKWDAIVGEDSDRCRGDTKIL